MYAVFFEGFAEDLPGVGKNAKLLAEKAVIFCPAELLEQLFLYLHGALVGNSVIQVPDSPCNADFLRLPETVFLSSVSRIPERIENSD